MSATRVYRHGRFTVERVQHVAAVGALAGYDDRAPRPTPPHRIDWARQIAPRHNWWLVVRDESAAIAAGYAVMVVPSRTLPGHRSLRVERMRFPPESGPAAAAVHWLADFARRDVRTIGLTISAFFCDAGERHRAAAIVEAAGLTRLQTSRMYDSTLLIDLAPEPDAIMAALHATARRHIRGVARHPVEIIDVHDPALAPRLDEIVRTTYGRSAARAARYDWPALIHYARAHPGLVKVLALVRKEHPLPDAVIAFALAIHRGDHVEYAIAGSVRPPDLNIPLGYGLAWRLMLWGREEGARWFDFGGISTSAEPTGPDRFKTMFTDRVTEVRTDWQLEPRPLRAAWVRGVRGLVARLRMLGVRGAGRRSPEEP